MAIESLVRKNFFLTSEQSVMFCKFVDRGRQLCSTEGFLICFLNTFLILITKAYLIFDLFKFLTRYLDFN
jgi:hypothetical protein